MVKYLVTDMDGVVFDRMPLYKKVFEDCLEGRISREISGDHYHDTLGLPLRLQMKGALALRGIVAGDDEIEAMVREYWERVGGNDVKLFEGVKEIWDQLHEQGMKFCASSGSNTKELGSLIEKFGLPYDIWLGSDEFHKGDKHIEIFAGNYSLEIRDFCAQAVFLGDGTVDMEIAVRNHMAGIAITNTLPAEKLKAAGAQIIIQNIRELPAAVEKINHEKF